MAVEEGLGDGLRLGVDVELAHGVVNMKVDGLLADRQNDGDLGAGLAGRGPAQYFDLAFGQIGRPDADRPQRIKYRPLTR